MYLISQNPPRSILARYDTEAECEKSEVLTHSSEPLFIYQAVKKVTRGRGKKLKIEDVEVAE